MTESDPGSGSAASRPPPPERLEDPKDESLPIPVPAPLTGEGASEQPQKKKKGKKKTGRGRSVETFFRVSYRMHVDMSSLADTKANIMISINGIIISVLLAGTAGFGGGRSTLLLPASAILLGALASMVFAVLAARPRVGRSDVTLEEARADRKSILFFGSFVSLPAGDFVEAMDEMLDDAPRLHAAMLRDIHGLGVVLDRKFRLLRTSYTLFMWGMGIGGVLYFLALVGIGGGSVP